VAIDPLLELSGWVERKNRLCGELRSIRGSANFESETLLADRRLTV
jgi:hypothetical protein